MMTDPQIRAKAAEILREKPWEHDWKQKDGSWYECQNCHLCGEKIGDAILTPSSIHGCRVPDPLTDPLPVIAERLLRKALKDDKETALWRLIRENAKRLGMTLDGAYPWWWFTVRATMEERCEVLIQALEKQQ